MEIWKDISGYEELYQVSNFGRIRNIRLNTKSKKDKVLKVNDKDSYIRIKLSKGGVVSRFMAHRLVAITFIPNPDNKLYVNHKDGNTLNNGVDNLEWCTQKENIFHSKNVTKSGAVISAKKIMSLYEENKNLQLEEFVRLLVDNTN